MKAARQQAQDLEQASSFLNAILVEHKDEKPQPPPRDSNQPKSAPGKARSMRLESRFVDPPAPPPQQPLPEKPDAGRAVRPESPAQNFSKRSEVTKPATSLAASAASAASAATAAATAESSQILSLVQQLNQAKKELDTQGARVKQLEDLLQQERSARENAEERARELEQHTSQKATNDAQPNGEQEHGHVAAEASSVPSEPREAQPSVNDASRTLEESLQRRLDHMVAEMQQLKDEMERFQKRAEVAESDANKANASLAEMVAKLRQDSKSPDSDAEKIINGALVYPSSALSPHSRSAGPPKTLIRSRGTSPQANGHIQLPARLPKHMESAVTTVLRESHGNDEALAQSAPYISMLGVVLIGVGLMAYLNSWQKTEK